MKNIFIHFLKCWIGFLDTQSLAIYFHRDSYGSEYENKNGVCIKLGKLNGATIFWALNFFSYLNKTYIHDINVH